MLTCPKCQFIQPKDRFCANCGVDMEAYRPVQPPLATRLAKNWMVQLGVFIFAVIVGIVVIRGKNRAQFSESLAAIEQATSTHKNFLSKKPVDQKVAQNLVVQAPQPAAKAEPLAPVEAKPIDAPVAVQADAATSNLPTNPLPTKLKLVFAEVNRAGLATLVGDSRSIASFGTYISGLLPEREDKSKPGFVVPGLVVLDSANDLQLKPNQPIVVFKGSRDPQIEQNLGLTTQITPTFIDEQGAHLQIEVKRTLRAPAGSGAPITEETFQEQMVLKKDGRGYMSGIIPHRVLSDDEAHLLSSNPTILKVLASNDFQNSTSEFVLFIEAK